MRCSVDAYASSYASCIWCATACASCHGRTT
ncbi:TPA: EAST1 family heat-stable enterotoxin, partial [Escherichia coli]|nr:EAST1 family heat-stable enterotoxin [Escherichia coli]